MNQTEHHFQKIIDTAKEPEGEIVKKFIELYCEEGYDLILQDAAELLDVEPKWLIRSFGDKFDYIIPPAPSAKSFTDYVNSKMMDKLGRAPGESVKDFLFRSHTRRRGYARKKVFINRKSFYEFLKENLNIAFELKQVAIPRTLLYGLKDKDLDKVRDEMLLQFDLAKKSENGTLTFKESKNTKVDDEQFDSIIHSRMFSQKTLSTHQIKTKYENPYQAKRVGDKKFREWLLEVNIIKVTFKQDKNERPVVRYLFESEEDLDESLRLLVDDNNEFKKENYIFNISVDMDYKEVKDKFIFYLNFLISEGIINKPKDDKSNK